MTIYGHNTYVTLLLIGGPALYIVGRTETEGVYSIAGYAVLLCFSAFYMILSAVVIRKVHDSANKSQQVREYAGRLTNWNCAERKD